MNYVARKRGALGIAALLVSVAIVLGGCGSSNTTAQAKHLLNGKTVTLIIPYSPGGGFDLTARLAVPYLEKYSGATVVPENVTGGGGMVGENKIYESASNGLTIGETGPDAMVFNSVTNTPGVAYQPQKFVYLAGATSSSTVLLMSTKSPYTSIDQLKSVKGLKIGATGAGDNDFYAGAVMFKALGIPVQWVTGYGGSSQLVQGLASGNPVGILVGGDTADHAIVNGFGRPVLQINVNHHAALENIPTILSEVPSSSKYYTVVQAISDIETADRAFVAPPGLSPALTAEWQNVFQETFSNTEFLQKMQKAGLTTVYRSGPDLQTHITQAMQEGNVLVPLLKAANAQVGS